MSAGFYFPLSQLLRSTTERQDLMPGSSRLLVFRGARTHLLGIATFPSQTGPVPPARSALWLGTPAYLSILVNNFSNGADFQNADVMTSFVCK
jgi:hypothetical protein